MSPDRDADEIPTLTDAVAFEQAGPSEETIAELHTDLTVRILDLADELLHDASREVEAVLFERVRDRLRAVLPELIDEILRERLAQASPPSSDR